MVVALFIIITFSFVPSVYADVSLQALMDESETGEILRLPAGKYSGNVTITKPISIIGEDGVEITSTDHSPVLTIEADNVTIENVSIVDNHKDGDSATIMVNGDNNDFQQISIETTGIGMKLLEAHENRLSEIRITGNGSASLGERGHGIDVWGSHHNTIQFSTFDSVKDGIYVESSVGNQIIENKSNNSRYGFHLMFTEKTMVKGNHASNNTSGIMVMGTEGTEITENRLTHNRKSIQSQGLLLFDVKDAIVTKNELLDNRIGIYAEIAQDSELTNNKMQQNYIGMEFKDSESNRFKQNILRENVIQGQAEASSDNDTNGNYWGDFTGLDTDGDGLSNLSYTVDPFFLTLTSEYPLFQLYFQAPGIEFLKQFMHTPTENWFIDEEPLIAYPLEEDTIEHQGSIKTLLLSIVFVLTSTSMIYIGRKAK